MILHVVQGGLKMVGNLLAFTGPAGMTANVDITEVTAATGSIVDSIFKIEAITPHTKLIDKIVKDHQKKLAERRKRLDLMLDLMIHES